MRAHGPIIDPSRCPAALEGDSGTVAGLNRTITNPITAIIFDNFLIKSDFDDRAVPVPTTAAIAGIQNHNAACIIASIQGA